LVRRVLKRQKKTRKLKIMRLGVATTFEDTTTVITPISQYVQGTQCNVDANLIQETNVDMKNAIILANKRTKSQAKKYRNGMKKLIKNATFMEGMIIMDKSINLTENEEIKKYTYIVSNIFTTSAKVPTTIDTTIFLDSSLFWQGSNCCNN
jgi:deoxyadenosine/deoxycytidine kinase